MAVRAQAQTLTQFDLNGQTGYEPYTTVTQATDGNFYGTTGLGGPKADGNIFRMTPTGEITNLYNFCSLPKCADGRGGQWPPILAPDGNLYLVTSVKSANILYKLTVDGELTNLFTFCSNECPGPLGITLASDGNFYGTSGAGGVSNNGTIFRVSRTESTRYSILFARSRAALTARTRSSLRSKATTETFTVQPSTGDPSKPVWSTNSLPRARTQ